MSKDDLTESLEPVYRVALSTGLLFSAILLYQVLVDFELSVIGFLGIQLRTHIFGIVLGMILGGILAEAEHSENSLTKQLSILSGVFTILFFGVLTFINTEIASLVLIYVGLWYSINSYRIVLRK